MFVGFLHPASDFLFLLEMLNCVMKSVMGWNLNSIEICIHEIPILEVQYL
jgi:hypothetical protein